jgi:hypothetical protein
VPRRPPVALLAAALAAACSTSPTDATGPVPVAPARPLAAGCAALVARLPHALGDARWRATTPTGQGTAAWGDPPVTLVCGGPPANPLDEQFSVDGVRWALHDTGPGRSWTTLDRTPVVVVAVPDAYENQAELVGALVAALSAKG